MFLTVELLLTALPLFVPAVALRLSVKVGLLLPLRPVVDIVLFGVVLCIVEELLRLPVILLLTVFPVRETLEE